MSTQVFWYALFRNDGDTTETGREIKHMVVAWLDEASMNAEVDRYIAWDKNASGATKWDIVQYTRTDRPEGYFKDKNKDSDPDLLEYHWVWEDFQNAVQSNSAVLDRSLP